MKKLFFTFFIFISFIMGAEASHKTKIAIVTSFKSTDGKNIFNFIHYDSNIKVEKKFKKQFNPKKFDLLIIHHASLKDVWDILHDNSIDALFFIGHGSDNNGTPMGADSIILDENLVNLKYAFSNVNSNLKYLAVISCFSEKVINPFIDKGFYRNAPQLKVTTFPGKIELTKGINAAIQKSIGSIATTNDDGELVPMVFEDGAVKDDNTDNDEFFNLELSRAQSEDDNLPALVIYNEKAIGFFPGEASNTIFINIPKKDLEKKSKSITVDTGVMLLEKKLNLGELKLGNEDQGQCLLNAERNKKGDILGVTKNYYKLKCESSN